MEIRHGTTRTVLLIGRWAFKIPSFVEWRLFLLGLLANMQERKFTTLGDPLLCPVIFQVPGGFLCVMPRCTPLTRHEYSEHLVELKNWPLPVEHKLDSVGWLNGRIVAVDYGN